VKASILPSPAWTGRAVTARNHRLHGRPSAGESTSHESPGARRGRSATARRVKRVDGRDPESLREPLGLVPPARSSARTPRMARSGCRPPGAPEDRFRHGPIFSQRASEKSCSSRNYPKILPYVCPYTRRCANPEPRLATSNGTSQELDPRCKRKNRRHRRSVRLSRIAAGLTPADRPPKSRRLNPAARSRTGFAPWARSRRHERRTGQPQAGGTIVEPTSRQTGHGPRHSPACPEGYRFIRRSCRQRSRRDSNPRRAPTAPRSVVTPTDVPGPRGRRKSYYRVGRPLPRR